MRSSYDLIIVGGGIVGCSAAAFAAERGASVLLVEATAIGAGASGRNSGAVQHPFDALLAPLHAETLDIYRHLSDGTSSFHFPDEPAGIILLADDLATVRQRAGELAHDLPELDPTPLDADELQRVEPGLASDLGGLLLRTGYPIPPEAATSAMADRARRASAELRLSDAVLAVDDRRETSRVRLASGADLSADSILLAAGPWTPQLADPSGAWRPLRPTYGVTVQLEVEPARHVLEEETVHTVNRPIEEEAAAADAAAAIASTFSMVSVDGLSTVGSTFLAEPPDADRLAPILVTRGARFVPALRASAIVRARVCARPQSLDGRPFIGLLPGRDGVFVCVGHGPWGISTGPASARMAVDAILTRDEEQIAAELRAARAAGPST